MPDSPHALPDTDAAPPHAEEPRRAEAADDAAAATEAPGHRVTAHAAFSRVLPRRSRRRRYMPVLMLAGTLLLTAVACAYIYWSVDAGERRQFENACQSAKDRVRARFDTYIALLAGARGLFAASHEVTSAEFHGYVSLLDLQRNYPGIRGLGFSRRVSRDSLPTDSVQRAAALLALVRAGGAPVDSVWPRPGLRDEYHAVVFLEPLDARNRVAMGFDMHTDPTRDEAMDRARDEATAAASGRVILKQENTGPVQPGFLVYLPVYAGGVTPSDVEQRRALLFGFVYAPFRAGDLFRGIFGSEREPRVDFRVYDGADTSAAALLYASPGVERVIPRDALVKRDTLRVGGRLWTLVFTPTRSAHSPSGALAHAELVAIALFGVVVGLALFEAMRAEVRARESAEHSEALRGRFFAAMSHELRTPVNAVLGYNELLLTGIYGPLAPQQQHGIQRSQRAARHLLELVNDVLDLSKLEAGKVEIVVQPVRLDELLEDLLVTIRPMAEERGCDLRLERPGCARSIETDPRRLRQIMLNLLSNATKFGAGQPVVVTCALLPHGAPRPRDTRRGLARVHLARSERRRTAGDAVVVSVSDGGPGIAPTDQERIFEEFVQLPGSTPGGTGLGLPISRRLAELLGGYLTVESSPGHGSTFSVTIPCKRAR